MNLTYFVFITAAAVSGGLPGLLVSPEDGPLPLVNKGGLPTDAMHPLSLVKHLQQMQQQQQQLPHNPGAPALGAPSALHLLAGGMTTGAVAGTVGAAENTEDQQARGGHSMSPGAGLSSKFEADPEALSLVKKAGPTQPDINDNERNNKEQIVRLAEHVVKQEAPEESSIASTELAQ